MFEVFNSDCVVGMMNYLEPCSIDLVVTSPPYHIIKSYEEDTSNQEYVGLMEAVYNECFRILKPSCYLVVNFGDCFNSGDRFYEAEVPSVFPASVWHWEWGRKSGFDLQATRIWRKQFSKMSIPFVCNTHPRNIFDYEHIWAWRKPGDGGKEFVNDRKLSQRGVLGDDWSSPAKIGQHCAAFPVELPLWAINVYSKSKSDLVVDPFTGSGTTGIACMKTKRRFVGFEIDPNYHEIAIRNIEKEEKFNRNMLWDIY